MRVRCYLLSGGLSPGPALLSGFDRLSAPDRRSPTSCFSASDRVSVPDRRSFEVRLPSPDRFSSLPIVVSVGLPRIMLDRVGLSHESRPLGLGNFANQNWASRFDAASPAPRREQRAQALGALAGSIRDFVQQCPPHPA